MALAARGGSTRSPGGPGRPAAATVLAALALSVAAACTGLTTAKSGGEAEPRVLSLVLAEGLEVVYRPAVEHFADQVHKTSNGSLVVDITWGPAQREAYGELDLISRVRDGEVDLSHVPARTFDLAGIERFAALQDPFTLDTFAAADALAQSSLAGGLLAGLEEDGLVGLGMYAESLRRPVGYRGALLRPEDLTGRTVRAQPSALSYDLLTTLGARPAMSLNYVADEDGQPYDAAESAWLSWEGQHPFPHGAVISGNVVFFANFNVFVANPDTFAALEDAQQDALRSAAGVAARWWATTYRPSERQLAERWCAGGRQVVMADPADLAAFRSAARPVAERLENDPATAATVRAVRDFAAGVRPEPFVLPRWCEAPTGDGARLNS